MPETETPVGYLVSAFWNQSHLSKRLVASYKNCSSFHWRWIFINNGSSDDTESLKEYFSEIGIDYFWITNSENLGVSKAWNAGIRQALQEGGQTIGIINNDLIFTEGWDTGLLRFHEKNLNPVFCSYVDRGKLAGYEKRAQKFIRRNKNKIRNRLHSEVMFYTSDVLKQVGLFDERYFASYEDTDMFLRLRQVGVHPVSTGASVVWHGEGVSSRRHLPSRIELESRQKFFEKWKDPNILRTTGWELTKWQRRLIKWKDKLGLM